MTPQTLPEFPTQQQVLDAVARHAAGMPGPCRSNPSPGAACVYRFEDNACFIGGLVTDEEAERMEAGRTSSIGSLITARRAPDRLRHSDLRELLCDLQLIHDRAAQADWPERLRALARRHDLSTAGIDAAFPPA